MLVITIYTYGPLEAEDMKCFSFCSLAVNQGTMYKCKSKCLPHDGNTVAHALSHLNPPETYEVGIMIIPVLQMSK